MFDVSFDLLIGLLLKNYGLRTGEFEPVVPPVVLPVVDPVFDVDPLGLAVESGSFVIVGAGVVGGMTVTIRVGSGEMTVVGIGSVVSEPLTNPGRM